jgi:uncharacterized protein YfaS (alpha-2-macroglobulin family)
MLWIILILIAVIILLWKIVQIPSLSVATDKSQYDRFETVHITGGLLDQNGDPMEGKTVSIAIVPPSGDAYNLPDVVTQADGTFENSWEVPDDAVGGVYEVQAASTGATAIATFTQSKRQTVTKWTP